MEGRSEAEVRKRRTHGVLTRGSSARASSTSSATVVPGSTGGGGGGGVGGWAGAAGGVAGAAGAVAVVGEDESAAGADAVELERRLAHAGTSTVTRRRAAKKGPVLRRVIVILDRRAGAARSEDAYAGPETRFRVPG